VLHHPVYREKYALNLKREFPRIPFYDDFWRWTEWGEQLMALHINYESVEPWPLARIDVPDERAAAGRGWRRGHCCAPTRPPARSSSTPRPNCEASQPVAWDYRLGNRSALEWVLDQHKEKKNAA